MNFFYNDHRQTGVAVLPTAWGKSLLCAWLALSLYDDGHKTLMVVPTLELLKQNKEKLENYSDIEVGVYSGSLLKKESDKPLVIASINSLSEKHLDFKDFDHIIIDECHYKTPTKGGIFKKFISRLKPKKILGLTATPFVLGLNKGYSVLNMLQDMPYAIFKNIIHVTQVSTMIKEKRWSEIKYNNMPYIQNGLVLNSTGNDFTEESIAEVNRLNNVNNVAIKIATKLKNEKTLIYVESIEVADKMTDYLKKKLKGVRCEVIHNETPKKERLKIVEDFKNSNGNFILINHKVFVMGFDDPLLKNIIMAFPTNSLMMYYQIIGRLTRVHKDKKFGRYVDLCGNIDRFGFVENIKIDKVAWRDWSVYIGDKLITGVPLNSGVEITTKDIINGKFIPFPKSDMKMPFGKHKGTLVTRLPTNYRQFLIDSLSNNSYNNKEREELLKLLYEIRDAEINMLVFNKQNK